MAVVTWPSHGGVRFGIKALWLHSKQTQGTRGSHESCLEVGNLGDSLEPPFCVPAQGRTPALRRE